MTNGEIYFVLVRDSSATVPMTSHTNACKLHTFTLCLINICIAWVISLLFKFS